MDFTSTIERQRVFFQTGGTRSIAFRTRQLRRLKHVLVTRERDLLAALREDLRKPPHEAYASEIGFVISDIDHALRNLPRWMRPRRRPSPPIAWPARSAIVPEPYGVALILGPWNYPLQLLLSPLVGAIAAGNCACIKPSEYAPATSRLIAELARDHFPPEFLCVVEGGRETGEALLREAFDIIFFTGGTNTGRAVLRAAAEHLTPVTLELGGKNPCIVCDDANLPVAARRILWGKCLNAGQTCVAPDYVLVHAPVHDALLDALREARDEFFPAPPRESRDFGRIVTAAHFDRLSGYLRDGRIVLGGETDRDDLFIAPTILVDVDPSSSVMQEEVFGPILPIVPFASIESALAMLRDRPRPLALYLFSESRDVADRVLAGTSSGGACVNDTVSHILGKALPLGGVGDSGMGHYRGKASFDTFTHHRGIMKRGTFPELRFRYPPVTISLHALKRIYRFLLGR